MAQTWRRGGRIVTEFYLVRHGQTSANVAGVKQGTINDKFTYLNDFGKDQARDLQKKFNIKFADRLIVSPLHRTIETAAILNQTAKLPVSYDDRLLEISYGMWDGQKNADLERRYPEVFDHKLHDVLPSYAPLAMGETFEKVQERVGAFTKSMVKRYPGEQLVIVTHGFTIKAFALNVLQPADPMSLPEPENTSVTKITVDVETDKMYLDYYNRH